MAEKDLLSEIIKLSVSSYGETPEDIEARRLKLTELGLSEELINETMLFESWLCKTDYVLFTRKISSIVRSGRDLFGYEVSDMDGQSDYLLTTDELIERTPGCCGRCVGVAPTLDELSFMLTVKKTGSSLIHVHTAEYPSSAAHDISPTFRTCVKIVINAETKGVVRLDFPPSPEGTHGDPSLEMIPVAVVGQDEELAFIFRSSTQEKNEHVTEILTADGTGFVVAKVGPVESVLYESAGGSTRGSIGKVKRDHFCILFFDRLLGRSWKQLLFSVSTVFFYIWLVDKAYHNKQVRKKQDEHETERERHSVKFCNCTIC